VEFLGKHSVFSAYTSIVTLISDLLPPFAKSKDNSNFWKISNPKGLGLLFPHPQSSARSYAEGSVLEFHRRALRLERTAADLTAIISRVYSNKLFMAALADTSMSQQMEFIVHHGGAVHGSGVDFWSTPNAPDRESEDDPKQHEVDPGVSDLNDMVSWMRANRDSAFSRQYVVVDEMTWGIPLLVTIIVTMGRFGSKVDQSVLSQAVCDVFRMRSGIITEVRFLRTHHVFLVHVTNAIICKMSTGKETPAAIRRHPDGLLQSPGNHSLPAHQPGPTPQSGHTEPRGRPDALRKRGLPRRHQPLPVRHTLHGRVEDHTAHGRQRHGPLGV